MRDDARLSYGLRDGQLGWDSRPPCLGSTLATLRAAGPRPSRRIRGGAVGSQRGDPAWICALCWPGGMAHWEAVSSSASTVPAADADLSRC
ncbi:unnamed protein product [Urochloa humidicola]